MREVLLLWMSLSLAVGLAHAQSDSKTYSVEIYSAGIRYNSLGDYRQAKDLAEKIRNQEIASARKKVASAGDVRVLSSELSGKTIEIEPVEADISNPDENGWKTIQLAPRNAGQVSAVSVAEASRAPGFVNHYVAGVDALIPVSGQAQHSKVHKVASIKQLNEGLSSHTRDNRAPLLVVAEGDRVHLLELKRKDDTDKNFRGTPGNPGK